MTGYFGEGGRQARKAALRAARQASGALSAGGKVLATALTAAFALAVVLGSIGAYYGGTTVSAAQAVTVQFVGPAAVKAQEALERQVLQCGQETGTLVSINAVAPPFEAIGDVPGSAMKAPGAQARALVSCLVTRFVPKGFTVDLCPTQAANSGGITAGRLAAFVTTTVSCAAKGG